MKDVTELLALLDMAPEIKEVAGQVIDTLKMFEEEYTSIVDFIAQSQVRLAAGIYNGLREEGVDADYAFHITMKSLDNMKTAAANLQTK